MGCELSEQLMAWLDEPKEVIIVGIGNIFRGDDGVGFRVAEYFEKYASDKLKVIKCEAPERFIDHIASYVPSHVLLVDAADMGAKPGSIRLMGLKELEYDSPISTHGIPLNLIAGLIGIETRAEIALLGIQPSQIILNLKLSPPVRRSLKYVINSLKKVLHLKGILTRRNE